MTFRELETLARTRLASGELPLEPPSLTLATYGRGAHCSLCGAAITPDEVEYEIGLSEATRFRFHLRCHEAWDAAATQRSACAAVD